MPEVALDAPVSEGSSDRSTWLVIGAATLVGAVWRVSMLISKWSRPLLFNDSVYYSFQARANSQGRWFRLVFTGGPGAEHPPLASLLMTPASLLAHYVFWQRATNTLLGIAIIPLIGLLGLRIGGRRVAIVAAAIAALYPNLWMNDSLVMSESSSALLVVVVLLCAWRLQERFDLRSAALTGAVIGIAALSRSELLLLAPLLAFVGFRSHPMREWAKRALLVLVTASLVLLPWVAYNLTRFEAPVLLSTNDGITLLGSNCDQTYSGAQMGGWLTTCLRDIVPLEREDPSQLSKRERSAALHYVRHHLSRVPIVVGSRLLRAGDLYGLNDLVRMDVGDERSRWASWAGIFSWWLLMPLAVFGWLKGRRRSGWILAAPVINAMATTVLFYGAHRLRSPMEPVIVICAAMGVVSCADAVRSRAAASGNRVPREAAPLPPG